MGQRRKYMRYLLVLLCPAICIFCFMMAGHVINSLHCSINLGVVMYVCVFHCNDGTRLIPR